MKRLGFAFVVAAVVGCQSDRVLPAPSALIQDARHNDGNPFFFWTAPVVNQQPPSTQIFSPNLSPVLAITNLCGGAVVRTFSGSQISVSNARYHVNWRTSEDNLNSACTYRMTVTVGTKTLGFADVDVVDNGRELKNVNTNDFIPLLDDRTLPVKFFVGVGSQCLNEDSDCGEGTAHPDRNTVIVTTNGRAGVFIPAHAVDEPVTISIESIDERPCFVGLPDTFPGEPGATGNSCYDYTTDPPLSQVNKGGRFNVPVVVGICPDIEALQLAHEAQDLLQLYQFDVDEEQQIRALNNVAAPFLRCDPGFNPNFGARRSRILDLAARGLRALVQPIAALIKPRPLYAGSYRMMLDIGTGGESEFFSRFMWALPADNFINFDVSPEGGAVSPGTLVNTLYTRVGVTFSHHNSPLEGPCSGTAVYANSSGGYQNDVSVCPEGTPAEFSEDAFGTIQATFTLPAVEACVHATPVGEGGQAYIEAFDASGESLNRTESDGSATQQLCVSGEEDEPIKYVRFAGQDTGFAIFDNFYFARILPQIP